MYKYAMLGRGQIESVDFAVRTDRETLRASCAEIASLEIVDADGTPIHGGVYDLRLGTTDHAHRCLTCMHDKRDCQGHWGHLNLNFAIIQPVALQDVRRWLKVVCLFCGGLMIHPDEVASVPASQKLAVAATIKIDGKSCPKCDKKQPVIVKDPDDHHTFWAESKTGDATKKTKLYPDTIRSIFGKITVESVKAMGRPPDAHPSDYISKKLAIPPNTIRPGVKAYGGSANSYHDLTNLLQHLVNRNARLPTDVPAVVSEFSPEAPPISSDLDNGLRNFQQLYYDFVIGSSATPNNGKLQIIVGSRALESILRALPRKSGRIRRNLLGKRVFSIGRSTISGNSSLPINAVGVPLSFARTLQVEETVQPYNIDRLMPIFLNGRERYPGCTVVIRKETGAAHDVRMMKSPLAYGDIIHRDIITGDLVYFNRAPTLERSSIGVHYAVVNQDPNSNTIEMNVLACSFYNADFDGDAMIIHAARRPESRAEAHFLSAVRNLFISTKSSAPANGQVQDSTLGCAEMTRDSVQMDRFHAMSLFAKVPGAPPSFDGYPADKVFNGRDIVSMLLERTPISYTGRPSSFSDVYAPYIDYNPSEIWTEIKHGNMVTGVLDKKSIGAGAGGGVFHLIGREYGSHSAQESVFAFQQVVLQFLQHVGFTIGTNDLLLTPECHEQITALISSVLLESQVNTDRLLRGEIVPPIGETVRRFYERKQLSALNVPDNELFRWILGSIKPDTNGFFRMISTGSKGINPNLKSIMAVIGQTTIGGERIPSLFAYRRPSPYFPRYSDDPKAYGFVANSYMSGMTLSEFLSQSMNGRNDLIAKALSTASTGYFTRKTAMCFQSVVVDNYRTVSKGRKLVQMLYGSNGLDTRNLERVQFRTVVMDNTTLRSFASPSGDADGQFEPALERLIHDRDGFRRDAIKTEGGMFLRTFRTDILMPVNVRRLVESVILAGGSAETLRESSLGAKILRVEMACQNLQYVFSNEIAERLRRPMPRCHMAATGRMAMLMRAELRPSVLETLSDDQLTFVLDEIRKRYNTSLIAYGAAVGILAAQSIGEPLTQYMLDSHHRSVKGGTSKSGIVRANEIFGAKSLGEETSTSMLLPIRPEVFAEDERDPQAVAQDVANSIEFITLEHLVVRNDVLLEGYGALRFPGYTDDSKWITEFEQSHPLIRKPGDLSNWCLRCVMDKSNFVLKGADLELVVQKLRTAFPGLFVVHSAGSAAEIVMRAWLRAPMVAKDLGQPAKMHAFVSEIMECPIRGIKGITRAAAEKIIRHSVGSDGKFVEETRWAIKTSGTNLFGAMLHRAIIAEEVISSSVADTSNMLGIVAARNEIISEMTALMEDKAPTRAHLELMADRLTQMGVVTSIERAGMAQRDSKDTLLRMAFGDPIKVVTSAALGKVRATASGIAPSLLVGSVPKIGSFFNSFEVDDQFVAENTTTMASVLDDL